MSDSITLDPIPKEEIYVCTDTGAYLVAEFYAFNTKVSFQVPHNVMVNAEVGEREPNAEATDAGLTGAETTGVDKPNAEATDTETTGTGLEGAGCADVERVFCEARDLCRRYERLFSRTLPHSDISRINHAAGAPVEVSEDTFRLLQDAQYYCDKSEGTFDITIGPVIKLWDFANHVCPEEDELAAAVQHVNWRTLSLYIDDPIGDAVDGAMGGDLPLVEDKPGIRSENTYRKPDAMSENVLRSSCPLARLEDTQSSVDVGGIAKGFIADRIAELFDKRGIRDFSINLGGNVLVGGLNASGAPWVIGIRDPQHPGDETALLGAIEISDASVVTSGTAERSFMSDGVLYHHILNPRTGMPVTTDVASATVVAKRSIDAEGYSTTLVALGLERGMEFARKTPEIVAAFFIDYDNNLYQA